MSHEQDPRTYSIIGAAMEVHRQLGSGFLEAVYQEALALEMEERGIPFAREVGVTVRYKGKELGHPYRLDFLCFGEVVVENKAVARLSGLEEAQVIHYLKATGIHTGLLLNFGNSSLVHRRFVHGIPPGANSSV